MHNRATQFLASVVFTCLIIAPASRAQTAKAPDQYTVTEMTAMFGPPETLTIYRDGSKVVIDTLMAGTKTPARTFYDLQSHTNQTWDMTQMKVGCSSGTFSGDWGDPFAQSGQDVEGDLIKQGAKQTGTETVNGYSTKVYAIPGGTPEQAMKVWIEPSYGMVVKLEMGGKDMMEIKAVKVGKPDPSIFQPPATCKAQPPMKTETEQISEVTGGHGQDYANAILPPNPASTNSCTVLFKVVHSGSLQPMTSGFRVKLGLSQDTSQNPTRDVTSQMQNGVLRIDDAPPHFSIDVDFSNGASSGLIYRQCFQSQTVLLLLVKGPSDPQGAPDWLWSKTGK